MEKISRYLDAAVLKPNMTRQEAREAIELGVRYDVKTVCVRPCDIELAQEICKGSDTAVSCVLDFPHGAGGADAKAALAELYAGKGVYEIDMVMNYGYARGGCWDVVQQEIEGVVKAAHAHGVPVKVIFETSELTPETIEKGVKVCIAAGADFVKTSTGFSSQGATVEAVETMLRAAEGRIKVKASGGIRNYETAKKYVDMGCERLGVGYSSTQAICDGGESNENY